MANRRQTWRTRLGIGSSANSPPAWQRTVLFFVGVSGIIYEAAFTHGHIDTTVLGVFAACAGLPAYISRDNDDEDDDPPARRHRKIKPPDNSSTNGYNHD